VPLFRFKMESQEDDHYRQGTCEFPSKDEARAELLRREEERAVPFRLPDDELAQLEQAEQGRGFTGLSSRERSALHTHRQVKPYKLVRLEEVK
jgi:hypothetical protein